MSTAALQTIFRKLGIPADYPDRCTMARHSECMTLVPTELDVFGRQPYLHPDAFIAWTALREAASASGIILQLVSAYRSHHYQAELLQRKLGNGLCIEDILKINAAPGYSEHHSGRAIDIGTPGFAHLEEEFELSPAFAWLQEHAPAFGFRLSFPRNNPFGVLYEPWHWYFL